MHMKLANEISVSHTESTMQQAVVLGSESTQKVEQCIWRYSWLLALLLGKNKLLFSENASISPKSAFT